MQEPMWTDDSEEFLFRTASEEVQLFKRITKSREGDLKSQVRMYKLEPLNSERIG